MTVVNRTEIADDLFSESLELIPTAAWIYEAESYRLVAANKLAQARPEPQQAILADGAHGYSTSILSFSGRPDMLLVSTSDASIHNLVQRSVSLNEKIRVSLQSLESVQTQIAYAERVLRTAMNEFNESTTENLRTWLTDS